MRSLLAPRSINDAYYAQHRSVSLLHLPKLISLNEKLTVSDHPLTGHKPLPLDNSEAGNHPVSFVRTADAA